MLVYIKCAPNNIIDRRNIAIPFFCLLYQAPRGYVVGIIGIFCAKFDFQTNPITSIYFSHVTVNLFQYGGQEMCLDIRNRVLLVFVKTRSYKSTLQVCINWFIYHFHDFPSPNYLKSSSLWLLGPSNWSAILTRYLALKFHYEEKLNETEWTQYSSDLRQVHVLMCLNLFVYNRIVLFRVHLVWFNNV